MAPGHDQPGRTVVRRSITIGRGREEVYQAFTGTSFLTRFAEHLDTEEEQATGAWHWMSRRLSGSAGGGDVEVMDLDPASSVRWRWVQDGKERGEGSVVFRPAPGDRGTEVAVELAYESRGGAPGRWLEKMLGREPGLQLGRDLFRLRQLVETGEVASTVGQPAAREATGGVLVSPLGEPSGRAEQ
jgi:uncharacterized membrane protein